MIAWTIESALGSPSLSRVIVSTDDEEIAAISREWGAEVPFLRPAELSYDDSAHIPVVIHAVQWVETHENIRPGYVVLLQPTVPLRTSDDIENAIQLSLEKGGDGVISVCEAPSHPYLAKTVTSEGRLQDFMQTPEGYLARQTFPPVYALNGAIYLVRRDVLIGRETLQTDRTYAYVMSPESSLDIDSPWDLYLADLILKDRGRIGPR